MTRRSKVLDAVFHLMGFEDLPQEYQGPNDLANCARMLMTVGDSGVLNSLRVQHQVVVIMRDDDPAGG